MASCVKVTTAKTLENALAKFKTPETYPAYEIRHDYHQSQSSVSISFYAKCVKPDSFRIQLMSENSIIYRAGIDENIDLRIFACFCDFHDFYEFHDNLLKKLENRVASGFFHKFLMKSRIVFISFNFL